MIKHKAIAAAGAALLLLSTAQAGHAKGMTLKQVQGLLTDLGYDVDDKGDNRIAIADQGHAKRDINFVLNQDLTQLNIYTALSNIPDDKKATVPMEALLKANDSTGPFAYAIITNNGKDRLDIEGYFDTALVTKPMLRRTLDALIAAEDAGEPLWNDDHWTAPAGAPKSLDEAKADYEAALAKSPLSLEHGTFVTESPTFFGGYTKRPDNVFKPGETITAYMEPQGYTGKPLEGDLRSTDISIDMLLSDKDGNVIADKKGFLTKSFKAHGTFMGLFLNIDLNVNGLPAGDYVVRYTVHDLNSDKTAEQSLPFKMAS